METHAKDSQTCFIGILLSSHRRKIWVSLRVRSNRDCVKGPLMTTNWSRNLTGSHLMQFHSITTLPLTFRRKNTSQSKLPKGTSQKSSQNLLESNWLKSQSSSQCSSRAWSAAKLKIRLLTRLVNSSRFQKPSVDPWLEALQKMRHASKEPRRAATLWSWTCLILVDKKPRSATRPKEWVTSTSTKDPTKMLHPALDTRITCWVMSL